MGNLALAEQTAASVPTPDAGFNTLFWESADGLPYYKDDGAAVHALAGVSSVGATLPITSTGGTTPVIAINAATPALPGSMSAADKTKLDGLPAAAQPLDATLTALAANNWVLDSIPVGSGADTVTQLAIPANTFPARSSVGGVLAKALADVGFAFIAATTVAAQMLLLNPATTSLAGLMSASDKSRNDNWYNKALYNVLDNGISTANTGAQNVTAWNALMALSIDNATIFFPPSTSTYDFASVAAIPAGRHIRVVGGGNQKSIIRTTSATANIFTAGDWYNEFVGLKFTSSVVRTAGAAIVSGDNVGINAFDCDFAAMFNGIDYSGGASAGNLAIVRNCHFTDTVNFSIKIDGTNANSIIVECTADCTVPAVTHLEVNACGSLLIANTDFIRATSNMRLNPDSGTKGVFSVYCTNVFFDTASGSSVKYMGAGTTNIQRSKYTNCWFSGSVNGIEFASTAATLPTAIDFVNCDIYSNSANGILATAVQDFSVAGGSRIAGNTTAGISIVASAGAVTKFNLSGNRIGPTAGVGANGTGVLIAAGTYGPYIVTGNNCEGNTTANINDGGVVTGFNQKQVANNTGDVFLGQLDARVAATAAFNTTETIIVGGVNVAPLPFKSLTAKRTFRFKIWGTCTSTIGNATTIRIRIGTAGTTGDGVVMTVTTPVAAVTGTAIPWEINGTMTIRTVGAAATVHGTCVVSNQSITSNATASTGIMVFAEQVIVPTFATFDSTVNNYVSLTMVTAAITTTHTVQGATLDLG